MAQEIERKFLVIGEFKSSAFAQSHIVQGYISSARGRTVRVRIRDEKGYLTIKGASNASGTSRYEWEKELTLSEAEELMRLCEPGIIDKTRYLVRSGKHVFEVDEFYGENEGLGLDRILTDTDIGGLGYGFEYGYSIMEKIKLEGKNGDKFLNVPLISFAAEETAKTKEAKDEKLSLYLEIASASAVKAAGADYIVLTKPEAVSILRGLE